MPVRSFGNNIAAVFYMAIVKPMQRWSASASASIAAAAFLLVVAKMYRLISWLWLLYDLLEVHGMRPEMRIRQGAVDLCF